MAEDALGNVDNQRLDARSFSDVREHVRPLAGYWPGLASVLGLSPSAIREIEATHRLPAKCLDAAIQHWIDEKYKVEKFGVPSWMALVKAVEDRNGGRNPALAKKIAQEHPHLDYQPHGLQPAVHPRNKGVSPEPCPLRCAGGSPEPCQLSRAVQESCDDGRPQAKYTRLQPLSPTAEKTYQHLSFPMEENVYQSLSTPVYANVSSSVAKSTYQRLPSRNDDVPRHLACGVAYREFEPLSGWSTGNDVVLSSRTVTPVKLGRVEHFDHYKMDSYPHGTAVIINNQNFNDPDYVNITKDDELNLVQTFRNLGYKIELYNNLTAEKITAVLEEVGKRDHGASDSLVCCLLTYSDGQGNIYGCDYEKLDLDSLISKSLGGGACRTLYGKPKMVFVYVRCVLTDPSKARTEVDGGDVVPLVLPGQADFFYGTSSVQASSHHGQGEKVGSSLYITSLCEALCEHGLYADLTSIHEIVQCAVAVSCQGRNLKQITENSNRLTKKVYFTN